MSPCRNGPGPQQAKSRPLLHAPLLSMLIPYCLGITAAARLQSGSIPGSILKGAADLVAAAAFGIFLLWLSNRQEFGASGIRGRFRQSFRHLCLGFVLFMAGLGATWFWQESVSSGWDPLSHSARFHQIRTLKAVVLSAAVPLNRHNGLEDRPYPKRQAEGQGCRVRLAAISAYPFSEPFTRPVEIMAYLKGVDWKEIEPGQVLIIRARLSQVRGFKTPGAFDFKRYWLLRRIGIKARTASRLQVICLDQAGLTGSPLSSFRIAIERIRHRLMKACVGSFSNRDRAAVAIALTFGEKAWLGPELKSGIYASGIGHLFAVSGLHMAMVFLLVSMTAKRCMLMSRPLAHRLNVIGASSLLGAAACLCYCALAGFSPSSLRAFFMVAALALAVWMKKVPAAMNWLALAAWVLLLMSPLYLFDISFQLSFCAVFFLLLAHENGLFESCLGKGISFSILGPFLRFVMITLVAAAATAPLCAYYFQRFSTIGLLANILAVPLVEFAILPLLMASVMIHPLSAPLAAALWKASGITMSPVLALAGQPWQQELVFKSAGLHLWHVLLLLSILAGAFFLGRDRRLSMSLIFALYAALFSFFSLGLGHRPAMSGLLGIGQQAVRLHLLDVGSGLCQVLELPGGRAGVVDGGGFRGGGFRVGAQVVAPFIRHLGYRRLDFVVMSHPHLDHAKGALDLLREFPVGRLYIGSEYRSWPIFEEAERICRKRGIHVIHVSRPTKVYFDGASVAILPCLACSPKDPVNTRCLVVKAESQGSAALMPGDIDARRETAMSSRFGSRLRADILVAPHHGSFTSGTEAFLRAVAPKAVLISSGSRPFVKGQWRSMAERYRRTGALVYWTYKEGTISAEIGSCGGISIRSAAGL